MTLYGLLMNGGGLMVPIAVCSVVAVAVFVRKLSEFWRARLSDMAWLDAIVNDLSQGNVTKAIDASASVEHAAGPVVHAALDTRARRPDRMQAEGERVGSLILQRFDKHLGVLSFIAQVAPLLGLLGTVVGMVQLFVDLQAGGAGAAATATTVSSGIWQALLTTAAGLTVAVPALAGHTYLASRGDSLRLLLHDALQRTLTAVPLEHVEQSRQPRLADADSLSRADADSLSRADAV